MAIEQEKAAISEVFDEKVIHAPKRGAWKYMLPLLIVLIVIALLAWHFGWNAKAVAAGVVILTLLSNMIGWLLGIITLVPVIGPLIVKVLTLSLIWLLNAIGYLVSYVAIRRGYSKDVLTYRALTITLITGIVIGYVIGSFF